MRLIRTSQYQLRPCTVKNTFNVRCFFVLLVLHLVLLKAASASINTLATSAQKDVFDTVKSSVFSDPYPYLPQYKVTRDNFDSNDENVLLKHAKRTLLSHANFIDLGTEHKLLQANGICFSGTWKINRHSPYSGLYLAQTEVPVIVRASVSLSGTKQRDKRAFGIAIKLFPDLTSEVTENIFLMHSLGGTKTKYVANLPMTNEPALGELPPFSQLLTAYRLESDLEEADKAFSGNKANARFRPVSQLANVVTLTKKSLGAEKQAKETKTSNASKASDNTRNTSSKNSNGPYWLKASHKPGTPLVDKDDFRDELSLQHYPNHTLTWILSAAPFHKKGIDKATWQEIGELTLTESVVSLTCDTKLHFNHPIIE